MMTDPIADLLTRIRNAVRIERQEITLPNSALKKGVAEALKREGYLWEVEEAEGKPRKTLRMVLKYGPNGERVIRSIRRVSKPGCRVYAGPTDLKPVLNGLGIYILSTNKGVLSDREARAQKVGGEVLCEVW
jgi:small subunit ribosomal protein S8